MERRIQLLELEGRLVLLQLLETYRKHCDNLEASLSVISGSYYDKDSYSVMIEQFVGKGDVQHCCSTTNGKKGGKDF